MKELIQQMSTFELGLNVTITGLVLVFSMLLLLVAILILFGKISVALQNAADKRAAKLREEALSAMASSEPDDDKTIAAVVSDNDGLSEEVVAVISAAISAMYMGSNKKPVIKAIKKSAGRRSAWANAGISNNTRAF